MPLTGPATVVQLWIYLITVRQEAQALLRPLSPEKRPGPIRSGAL